MAISATAHHSTATEVRNGIFGGVGRFFAAVGRGLMYAAESNTRMRQVQSLQSKSDAELERLGIKRDEIVHRVFSDLYYL